MPVASVSLRSLCLSAVATAVLAAAAGCGCRNVEDERVEEDRDGTIMGFVLDDVRSESTNDRARCEAGCIQLDPDRNVAEIEECEATSLTTTDPWDPAATEVTISCTTVSYVTGFCTGRRPQGHHETDHPIDSRGAWLCAHAHLEAASVTAFEELAAWLQRRGAPTALVERCRAAAADEVRHAAAMTALARAEGSEPPAALADPPGEDLLEVAMHNAVEGCVHEAFAAIVAAHQAATVVERRLGEVFEPIARDELRHGQLAWDLHAWLCEQLSPAQRLEVEAAQQRALALLPAIAQDNARRTPLGLGWPGPRQAAAMAQHFGEQLDRARRRTA